METYAIKAEPRELIGKKVKRLRQQGLVPGVLYGHNVTPQLLSLTRRELERVYRQAGATSVVEIKLPDGSHNALIHAVHHHPVTGELLHADLYQVRMDEKVRTTVPLAFSGGETAPAVRELDGVLITNLTELEVEALPADLPHEIAIDLEQLKTLDDTITVADLQIPSGVTVLTDAESNVAMVQPPKTEEQLEAELAEDTEVTTADDVEVAGEEVAEDEGGEGEAASTEGEAAADTTETKSSE